MKKEHSKQQSKPKIAMAYSIKVWRKAKEPAPLRKQWSVEERKSILDYLHGDIAEPEVKACCYYEYARASETLRKAGRDFNPAKPISRHFPPWVLQLFCFLQCRDFPKSAWRDLSNEERENFRLLFKLITPRPIISDVLTLRGTRVFDAFREQAENAINEFRRWLAPPKPAKERKKPTKRVVQPAMVRAQPFIQHVVITIDYRDGVQAKKKQFGEWLASELNRKLFDKYYKQPKQDSESADHYKELLKFLAAWRLFAELGFKGAAKWTKENRRQKDYHRQPFFREKVRKTPTGRHYTGPLFKESRQWEAAIAKAKDFLAREIEVGQSTDTG